MKKLKWTKITRFIEEAIGVNDIHYKHLDGRILEIFFNNKNVITVPNGTKEQAQLLNDMLKEITHDFAEEYYDRGYRDGAMDD